MLESVENSTSFTTRKVELARSINSNVYRNDACHLLTERLCGDCLMSVKCLGQIQILVLQGFHRIPASVNASSALRLKSDWPDSGLSVFIEEEKSEKVGDAGALVISGDSLRGSLKGSRFSEARGAVSANSVPSSTVAIAAGVFLLRRAGWVISLSI